MKFSKKVIKLLILFTLLQALSWGSSESFSKDALSVNDCENFSDEEMNFISKKLTVTVFDDTGGVKSFREADDDFWRKISEHSGLLFDFARTDVFPSAAVENHDADGIFMALRESEGEKTDLAFTKPVRMVRVRFLPAKDASWEDFMQKGGRSASSRKQLFALTADVVKLLPYFQKICLPFDYRILESVDKCLEMTERGEFDAALVDEHFLLKMNDLNNYPSLKVENSSSFSLPVCLAVRVHSGGENQSVLLASVIDKSLSLLPDFYYDELLASRTIFEEVQPARTKARLNFIKVIICVCLLAFLLFMVLFFTGAKKTAKNPDEDSLTGLLNNDGFLHKANKILVLNPEKNFVIAELNVRNFSLINQINSSEYGDRMLLCIAKELSKLNKKKDTVLARGFADSFYILHSAGDNIVEDSRHMQHLCKAVQGALSSEGYPAVILGGCAFSATGEGSDNAGELLSRASYARKVSGTGFHSNFTVFDEQIRRRREIVLDIERSVDQAFEHNEFFVVFQPKISLSDGKVKGAEALVRWNSSVHGFVSPSVFIPVFEQSGYVSRLDFFVYQKVFEYQQEQTRLGRPLLPISVNVSRLHQNPSRFVSAFTNKFNMYSLPRDCIELEIVERFAGASDTMLIQLAQMLREAGFKVNMDDFGSGESSLNMLSEIPVDVIKFDQRFLRQAQTSSDSLIILSQTMNMVRKLGKMTVCEGVETREQIEMLREMDCDLVQGFFYSKPLTKDAFTGYVARHI